jgi:hypothetical protein
MTRIRMPLSRVCRILGVMMLELAGTPSKAINKTAGWNQMVKEKHYALNVDMEVVRRGAGLKVRLLLLMVPFTRVQGAGLSLLEPFGRLPSRSWRARATGEPGERCVRHLGGRH